MKFISGEGPLGPLSFNLKVLILAPITNTPLPPCKVNEIKCLGITGFSSDHERKIGGNCANFQGLRIANVGKRRHLLVRDQKKAKCNLRAKQQQLSFQSFKPRIFGVRRLRDPPLLVAVTTPVSPAQRDWQANSTVRYLNSSLRKQWPNPSGSSGSALSQHALLSGYAQSCPASPALRAHFEPEFHARLCRL